jgi:uncharacterized protein YggE
MKRSATCLFAAAAALFVAAPVASAETTRSVDTVSVVGVGRVPIPVSANVTEANAVYHAALVQAIGDGLVKARLLAEATGAKVGPIEAISEAGRREGYECKDAAGETGFSYKGAEPDTGSAGPPTVAVEPTSPPRPARPVVTKKRKSHKGVERKTRRVIARKAENTATSCELSTEVDLIYDLEVP